MSWHPWADPQLAEMFQCSSFPHFKTSFFVVNRNNHQYQYISIHNLYKSSGQEVENQLPNSSDLFTIIIIFHSSWYIFFKPDLTRLLLPISQSKTRISPCPMILHQIQGITCHKDHTSINLLYIVSHEFNAKKYVKFLPCNVNLRFSWWWGRLLVGCFSFHIFIFALGIRGGWEVWSAKFLQNLSEHKNEYS